MSMLKEKNREKLRRLFFFFSLFLSLSLSFSLLVSLSLSEERKNPVVYFSQNYKLKFGSIPWNRKFGILINNYLLKLRSKSHFESL